MIIHCDFGLFSNVIFARIVHLHFVNNQLIFYIFEGV